MAETWRYEDLSGIVGSQLGLQVFSKPNVERFLRSFALKNLDVEECHFPISV